MIVMMLPAFAAFVLCAAGYTVELVHPRMGDTADSLEPAIEVLLDDAGLGPQSGGVLLAA